MLKVNPHALEISYFNFLFHDIKTSTKFISKITTFTPLRCYFYLASDLLLQLFNHKQTSNVFCSFSSFLLTYVLSPLAIYSCCFFSRTKVEERLRVLGFSVVVLSFPASIYVLVYVNS